MKNESIIQYMCLIREVALLWLQEEASCLAMNKVNLSDICVRYKLKFVLNEDIFFVYYKVGFIGV